MAVIEFTSLYNLCQFYRIFKLISSYIIFILIFSMYKDYKKKLLKCGNYFFEISQILKPCNSNQSSEGDKDGETGQK